MPPPLALLPLPKMLSTTNFAGNSVSNVSDLLSKVGRSLEQKGRAGEARAVTILGAQYSEGRVGYAEAMQALAQLIGKDEIVAFVRRAAHGLE